MYDPEKQMLRELGWYSLRSLRCWFCHLPFLTDECLRSLTFGHRRHTKVQVTKKGIPDGFTLHHINEDREDNYFDNLAPCHSTCHKAHHRALAKERLHAAEQPSSAV